MKATVHFTAVTFDGQEVFTAGAYAGPNPEEALQLTRTMHQVGGIPWATVRGVLVDYQDVDGETMTILLVDEEPES